MCKITAAMATTIMVLLCCHLAFAQIGVKTHRGNLPSENLLLNLTDVREIHGESIKSNRPQTHDQLNRNAAAEFINRTRTEMAVGVCTKEVPTASLLNSLNGATPAGNGSDPSMSRIQVCCDGYKRNEHNFRKCDPICSKECINGLCVAPEVCKCFPDHVVNLGGFCVATCPYGCANGECMPDNTCKCKTGFMLENRGKYCMPKCGSGCGFGNCTAPNNCECDKGYHLSPDNKCVPKCYGGCGHGDCVAPDQCSCHAGYVMDNHICEPICTRGCINGKCTAPDTCSCEFGWTLDASHTKCEAKCDSPCLNGHCVGPNQCGCNSGYILDEFNSYRCLPHCPNGCTHGVCSGPNMCICNAGFVKDRSLKGSQRCIPRE